MVGLLPYGGGLAFLFLKQRYMLFPIPTVRRTAPDAAGFPDAEDYTSTVDVAGALFWFVPVGLLMRDQFHSDRRIARVALSLLVMHGSDDRVIPIGFGERLFALAHEPKQFVRFSGGRHDDLDNFGALDVARHFINAA
jgi:fermentation-respiration switch protein FrsA (DUF1100 family)